MSQPMTSTQLMAEAQKAQAIADELATQAGQLAAAERAASRPKEPQLSENAPAFLAFSRYLSGREYVYAGVGWRVGNTTRWVITGTMAPGARRTERYNWSGLLEYIGEGNWGSIRTLTPGAPLLPPGTEPPVAEVMGNYGTVIGTRNLGDPTDPFQR